jgi:hypothetical protein
MSTKTANPLTPHRVSLIRHRTTPNLRTLKRLFHFFQVREQAQVRPDFVGRGSQGSERGEDVYVDFAGVSLGGYGVGEGEAREGCY